MSTIGLYGIGGLYNFGCEAIVRGTISFVRKCYGEFVNIIYFSKNFEYDSQILENVNIRVIDIGSNVLLYEKVFSKVVDVFNLPIIPNKKEEYLTVINSCDIIFSIGGDLYTLPRYLMSKQKYRYVNNLVEFGKEAKRQNKKLYIFGASIGPFGYYKPAIEYFKSHLKQVDGIFCREKESIEYLESINVKKNVHFCPDPSFLVSDKITVSNEETDYIGINLSPWSLQEFYGNYNEAYLNKFIDIISNIIIKFQKKVLLIPHVISQIEKDNDYLLLKRVFDGIPEELKGYVTLAEHSRGFIGIKKEIRKCCVVIASRMHCGLNAVHENIPTIFISYSSKSVGMSNYVYGNQKFVVGLDELSDYLESNLKLIIDNKETLMSQLHSKNKEIIQDFNVTIDFMKNYN